MADQERRQVAQLRQELEQERSLRKQLHHDKVRDVKAAREKEQATAREQIEELRLKLQREKNQELQSLRDRLTKDFKTQLRAVQKRHDDAMQTAQTEWKKERQDMREKLREELQTQLQGEWSSKLTSERQKLTQELFEVESRRRQTEEALQNALAADRKKAEDIREMDNQHCAELERLQRAARLSSKQQLEELEEGRRKLQQRDRELSQLSESLSRVQADKERTEEELQRMKKGESWTRRSISPSSSSEEVNAVAAKQYSHRERDMVVRNSELSFHVRRLEERVGSLERTRKDLQEKLETAESQRRPLKEHNVKLSQRINDLNSALRSQEKQMKQLAQENFVLKSAKQQLEEEHARQRKSLKQQLSKGSLYRTEREKLVNQNRELAETTTNLYAKMEELEQRNFSLQKRLSSSLPSSLTSSPIPPLLQSDDEFGSQVSLWSSEEGGSFQQQLEQMDFEREESKAKYEELKSEYKSIRDKYKELKGKYQEQQSRAREQQAIHRQVQMSYELLKREKLGLEREVSLLRTSGRESPYDMERQQALLPGLRGQLREAESRVQELEEFIIEQDDVARAQGDLSREERLKLLVEVQELQEQVEKRAEGEGVREEEVRALTSRVAELEDANTQLTGTLQETQAAHEEHKQLVSHLEEEKAGLVSEIEELKQHVCELEEKLTPREEEHGRVMGGGVMGGGVMGGSGDSNGLDEPDAPETPDGGPLTATQLQQWMRHYQNERMALKSENQELRSRLAEAIEHVAKLQGLVGELEERLTEEEDTHFSTLSHKQEEITRLTTQLSQQESKLTRLRRAVSVGVKQQMSQQLGHKVLSSVAKVKGATAMETSSLQQELQSLEEDVNELLQTVFQGDFEPSIPLPLASSTPPPPLITSTHHSLTSSPLLTSNPPLPLLVTSSSPPLILSTPPFSPLPLPPSTPPLTPSTPPPHEQQSMEAPPPVPPCPPPVPSSPLPDGSLLLEAVLPSSTPPLSSSPPPDSIPPLSSSPPHEQQNMEAPPPVPPCPPPVPSSPLPDDNLLLEAVLPSSTPPLSSSPPPDSTPPLSSSPPHEQQNMEAPPPVPPCPPPVPSSPPPDGSLLLEAVLPSSSPPLSSSPPTDSTPPLSSPPPHEQQNMEAPPPVPPCPPPVPSSPLPDDSLLLEVVLPSSSPPLSSSPPTDSIPPLSSSPSPDSTPTHSPSPPPSSPPPLSFTFPQDENPTHVEATSHSSSLSSQPLPSEDTLVFVVVMDYDPSSLCTTGRPDLELSLQTGAVIAVHGTMDSNGYYTATFEGQTGLVPANFVQEVEVANPDIRQRLFNQTLARPYTPASLTPSKTDTPRVAETTESTSPSPPSEFHVDKALDQSMLLVCWQPPLRDEGGRSNNCLVTGYQLYVNNKPTVRVTGATQTRELLSHLDLNNPITLGISTCSQEGPTSEIITTDYQGLPHTPTAAASSTQEKLFRMPTAAGSSTQKEPFRMFVALYDYDPQKSSPSANPEFELQLKEGNLVKVFGREMSDGFFMGEVSGRRGLVPASFVSEVRRPCDQSLRGTVNGSDTILPATSKKMVAMYDYVPQKDSPNPNPDLELSFKAGDRITIYGNMDGDGFYSGELGGQFGLVPSNFLEEEEDEVKKRTPSPLTPLSSPSPSTSLPTSPTPPTPPSSRKALSLSAPPKQLGTGTGDAKHIQSYNEVNMEQEKREERKEAERKEVERKEVERKEVERKEVERKEVERKEEERKEGEVSQSDREQASKTDTVSVEESGGEKTEKDKKKKRGFSLSRVKLPFTRKRSAGSVLV